MSDELIIFASASEKFELIEASNGEPSVKMCAYSGGVMTPSLTRAGKHVRTLPIVVDLAGIEVPTQEVPFVFRHDETRRMGASTAIEKTGEALNASGFLAKDTKESQEVIASWKSNYPWKPSIGLCVLERRDIPSGEVLHCNNRVFYGPISVVAKSKLRHIGFVEQPGDDNSWLLLNAQMEETMGESVSLEELQAMRDTLIKDRDDWLKKMEEREKAARENVVQEQLRAQAVSRVAVNHPEILDKALRDGWTADATELEVLRAEKATTTQTNPKAAPETTSAEVLEACCAKQLKLYDNDEELLAAYGEKALNQADKLGNISIMEMAQECGVSVRYSSKPKEWLEAFSTTSLPGVMSNIANKSLLASITSTDNTWLELCKIGSVKDFKEYTRYRLFGDFRFRPLGAGGVIKHAEGLSEEDFKIKIASQGIMFSLERQFLINDDLGAIKDIPSQIGIGWSDTINDCVWTEFLTNETCPDGYDFYSANHHSLKTGGALTIDGIEEAYLEFLEKTLPDGKLVGREPEFMLVPRCLYLKANELMNVEKVFGTLTSGKVQVDNNRVRGLMRVVPCSKIQDTSYGAEASKTTFYMVGNKAITPCMEIAFLNGKENPTVESASADFDTLGIKFRGFGDFGVKKRDHRGILKITQ